jgi:hypothetical protein
VDLLNVDRSGGCVLRTGKERVIRRLERVTSAVGIAYFCSAAHSELSSACDGNQTFTTACGCLRSDMMKIDFHYFSAAGNVVTKDRSFEECDGDLRRVGS